MTRRARTYTIDGNVVDVVVRARFVHITIAPPAGHRQAWYMTDLFLQAPIGKPPHIPTLRELVKIVRKRSNAAIRRSTRA